MLGHISCIRLIIHSFIYSFIHSDAVLTWVVVVAMNVCRVSSTSPSAVLALVTNVASEETSATRAPESASVR